MCSCQQTPEFPGSSEQNGDILQIQDPIPVQSLENDFHARSEIWEV
jgi:hypothetical protein